MSRPWAECSTCGKTFVPRFSYQTEARSGQSSLHYCSIGCRTPELETERSSKATSAAAQHSCACCGKSFTMRFAYQVLNVERKRKVVCSQGCRQRVIEETRREPANVEAPRGPRAVAVLNQKGGTGKTTTSVSLAAGLAERGLRTLLIDLDAQGNVGVSVGVRGRRTLYHVLVDGVSPRDVAVPVRKNLDVITADQSLAAAELELVNAPNRARVLERRMADAMASDSPYDFVVLDCAPSLSLLNQNALVFARQVLVPVSCDYLSLVGVKQILRTLQHVREVLLTPVDILGVLPTLFDKRNNISKQSVEALESYFGEKVLAPIRVDVRLKEAPSHKKTIYEYAPESNGAKDYTSLVGVIAERLSDTSGPSEEAAPATAVVPAVASARESAS